MDHRAVADRNPRTDHHERLTSRRAKVELPAILILSIGSIWTATFKAIEILSGRRSKIPPSGRGHDREVSSRAPPHRF